MAKKLRKKEPVPDPEAIQLRYRERLEIIRIGGRVCYILAATAPLLALRWVVHEVGGKTTTVNLGFTIGVSIVGAQTEELERLRKLCEEQERQLEDHREKDGSLER